MSGVQAWRASVSTVAGRLVVVSGPAARFFALLGLPVALLLVFAVLGGAGPGPATEVWCSRPAEACSVARDGRVGVRLPLEEVARFEVFDVAENKRSFSELRAVTSQGNRLMVQAWPRRELVEAAARLNELLASPSKDLASYRHDGTEEAGRRAPAILFLAGSLLLCWLLLGPCALVLDHGQGTAWRLWPIWPRRWSSAQIQGVQCWSARNQQVERARHSRQAVPYSRPLDDRVWLVLVDPAGRRHRVSRGLPIGLGSIELQEAAHRVAEYLGVPCLPAPVETRAGEVPPPVERP